MRGRLLACVRGVLLATVVALMAAASSGMFHIGAPSLAQRRDPAPALVFQAQQQTAAFAADNSSDDNSDSSDNSSDNSSDSSDNSSDNSSDSSDNSSDDNSSDDCSSDNSSDNGSSD